MSSPMRRAPRRSSHLSVVTNEIHETPHNEGFLISDHVYKSGAVIDYTVRGFTAAASDRRNVVVPGYGGIKSVYGNFRDAVAEATEGDTASYRHPRSEIGLVALHPDKLLHPDKIGKQSVVAMIDVMRQRYPNQKVTLIGHSMGGPNAVEGALRRPNDVESVVLLGSGGLEAGQNVARLATRMPKIATQEGLSILHMSRSNALTLASQALFHLARNPVRTFGEAMDIGNRDLMVNELATLRGYGIGVHAVQLEHDGFFPTAIAERDTQGLVDSFTVIEGLDHLGPQTHPEIVGEHIANVLSSYRQSYAEVV